ncbi:helix-turn-helix domain-containing protein [Brevibacterium sp. H602]|uniref:helix-turn-helix domain-containing protein n=1 Tax=unclassified Brevibacterium TaxID=2614124 RepID=UPI003978DBA5
MADTSPTDTFARRLREERARADVSQTALAKRISEILGYSVDGTAVTRIERSQRAVRLDEAVAAAEALDVPLMTLLTATSSVDRRIRALRRDLELQEQRAKAAESEFQQAQSAMAHIQKEIEGLEASLEN